MAWITPITPWPRRTLPEAPLPKVRIKKVDSIQDLKKLRKLNKEKKQQIRIPGL